MSINKTAMAILCHPDDAEFMCVGTLALLKQRGWKIHISTVANGDCGSVEHGPEEIAKIRKQECINSAKILDAEYTGVGIHDIFLMFNEENLRNTIRTIRQVKPSVLFTASPHDYMLDHEVTSTLVRAASFALGIPNVSTPPAEAYEPTPYLYYADPMENKDIFGKEVKSAMYVDISEVMDTKEKMLAAHDSQRSWLMAHHGMDEYILSMKRFDAERGKKINAEYAEGFRQHLGHGYPQDNILKQELGDLLHEM